MTKFRKPLLIAMCVASMGVASIPLSTSAAVAVYFNAAPPPARVEVAPAARHGHLWVPGHWDVRGNQHVWKAGHWEKQRSGYSYAQPRWVERDNRWQLEHGRWNRDDRDGDGVSNSRDRAPDNPVRH